MNMYNFLYDYTIFPDNSPKKFKETIQKIEKSHKSATKDKLLIDVDGSTVLKFVENGKTIAVYDDYDVGAVYVKSEVNLDHLFG